MAFAGLRGTGDWGTDERPKNFREYILWANPNGSAPLTALLARAKKETVDDPQFFWWEETLSAVRVTINYSTGYLSTDTTLVIAQDGLRLVPGDILQVEKTEDTGYTNEFLEVSSVTNDTTIVVKRGAANTTAAAIANGTALTKLGSAFMEGSGAPSISARNPTKFTNYCEIFKTAVGITRTAEKTYARTGDAFANDKKRRSFDHSVAMEMAFLFGKAYEDTSGTKPKRFTGGLRQFISTNVKIYTTTPTLDDFFDNVYSVFNYNKGTAGDERIIFAGNGALNTLNKLVRTDTQSRINFDGIIKIWGMNLMRFTTPQGTFGIKTHPLMNLHPRYKYSMFVIDPTGLVYRPLRDTKFFDHTEAPGTDSHEGLWLTEAGLEVQHQETMAYIGNFLK